MAFRIRQNERSLCCFFSIPCKFSLTKLFLGAFLEKCAQDMSKSLPPFFLFCFICLLYVEFRSARQLFYLCTWIQLNLFFLKKKKRTKQFGVFTWVYWSAASSWCQNGWIHMSHYPCSQTTLQHCFLAFSFMHLQESQLSSLHLMQIKFLLSSALCMRHKWCSTKLSKYILHYLHLLVFLH